MTFFVQSIVSFYYCLNYRFSPKGTFIVASLLDCTIKVYKTKTMKFYLSLYGHKVLKLLAKKYFFFTLLIEQLPALTLDVSEDEQLLVSGSADKNVKVWGLDFGDCHRSLFAHDDTVTSVVFQHKTHYFFTAGKDGLIKQWNADKVLLISFYHFSNCCLHSFIVFKH